jgi:pre-mRNA-splicing factor CWC26
MKVDAQRRLNQGKVQQMKQVENATEMEILQNSTFARRKDDERLEDVLKNEIRKDDPMAKYAINTQQKKNIKNSDPQQSGQQHVKARPMYKGPQPKANRFGIRPGYRWDGVDRGNCFEDKIIAKKFSANHNKEKAYRWSSQDM